MLCIKSYHESKPLGHQTIFGKVTCVFLNTLICASLFHGAIYFPLSLTCILSENHDIILQILTVMNYSATLSVNTGLYFLLITKYLSIYHGTFIYSLDEDIALSYIKRVVTLAPVFLTSFEYVYLTDIKTSLAYRGLSGTIEANGIPIQSGTIRKVNFVLLLSLLILLNGRIEYEENRFQKFREKFGWLTCSKRDSAEENNMDQIVPDDRVEYKSHVLRAAIVILGLFGAWCFYQFESLKNLKFVISFNFTIINVILPTLFIHNHKSLKHHCLNKLRTMFCCK